MKNTVKHGSSQMGKNKLYIDCRSGISGDMMLGAFVSLGVPEEILTEQLALLNLDGFHLEINRKETGQVSATDVDVILHDKANSGVHPYSGKYRNYGEIKKLIDKSGISVKAKDISKRIFNVKAGAESKVHGVPVDEVQFHEAGAVDSVVDIVGTAICYDYLAIDRVIASCVPTGYGTVQCACGQLPVPAPAVKEILQSQKVPHYRSEVAQELLTPTGAAILAGIVDEFHEELSIPESCRQGCGTGKRSTGLPPLCLVLV